MIRLTQLFAVLALLSSWQLSAAVLPAANATDFNAVLKAAKPGDTILLAPSADLGWVSTAASFTAPVTIASADPARPGHISSLKLNGAHNLIFSAIDIGRDRGAEPEFAKQVEIRDSSDIAFVGGSIHGSRDGDPSNDMIGLLAAGTTRLRLTGVTVEEVFRAITFDRCSDVAVEQSELRLIRSDGIDIAGVTGARIVGNRISRFVPAAGDHADAVQLWTTGEDRGSTDIEISNNLILSGPEGRAQGIFLRDELGLFAQARGYARITIRGNTLVGTGWHGIAALDAVDGLMIEGNTLLRIDGADVVKNNWITSAGGRVAGNRAPLLTLAATVVQADNVVTGPAKAAEVQAAQGAWERANRGPTKAQALAKLGELLGSIDAAWSEFQAAR